MRCRGLAIALGSVVTLGACAIVSAAESDGEAMTIAECSPDECLRDFLAGREFRRAYGERSPVLIERFDANGDWQGITSTAVRRILVGRWRVLPSAIDDKVLCIDFAPTARNGEFSGKKICRRAQVSEGRDLVLDDLYGYFPPYRLSPE